MKCELCPVRELADVPCFAQTSGHERFCGLVAEEAAGQPGRSGYTAMVQKRSVEPPELPGLLERAGNFVGALAGHLADGAREVDEPIRKGRLALCEACVPWFQASDRTCRALGCGCYVDVKTRWASEQCPKGKWPAV